MSHAPPMNVVYIPSEAHLIVHWNYQICHCLCLVFLMYLKIATKFRHLTHFLPNVCIGYQMYHWNLKNQTHNIFFFVEKISSSKITTISFTQIMFSSWNIISLNQRVPNLQDPMPDDWRGSWCNNNRNKGHSKCNGLQSFQNHLLFP